MSTPIKREDIRKGDIIRRSEVFTALNDYTATTAYPDDTYELLERPVVLPTEPGWYVDRHGCMWKMHKDGELRRLTNASWVPESCAPFTLLRPVAEVAAEVLADVRNLFGGPNSGALLHKDVDKIAAKFGVTK